MLRSLELRFRGHSFAEQLALSRRIQFCFLPMRLCPCQVGFRIPQRELERSGIERGESRALLDLVTRRSRRERLSGRALESSGWIRNGLPPFRRRPLLLPLPARQ